MSLQQLGSLGGAGGASGSGGDLVAASAASAAATPIKAFSIDIMNATLTSNALVDGVLRLTGIVIPEDFTATGFTWLQDQQGSNTGDNENRLGVYTSDGTDLTLVQSSANNASLWESAVGRVNEAASATRVYNAGDIVWIAALMNHSAQVTAANIVCAPTPYSATAQLFGLGANEAWNGYVSGQATLPATIAWASVVSSGLRMRLGFGLY